MALFYEEKEMKYFEEEIFEGKSISGDLLENLHFSACRFIDCRFEQVTLLNCHFSNCDFKNCHIISPRCLQSTLEAGFFRDCNLIGLDWWSLRSKNLLAQPFVKIQNSYLKYNTFVNLNLKKFDFRESQIEESSFEDCQLTEALFSSCSLNGTTYLDCDLRKANFKEAKGYLIDVTRNLIKEAQFSYPEALTLLDSLGIIVD